LGSVRDACMDSVMAYDENVGIVLEIFSVDEDTVVVSLCSPGVGVDSMGFDSIGNEVDPGTNFFIVIVLM
ncbi:hypothetical protein KI387_005402, partial [Taxus chinensis]